MFKHTFSEIAMSLVELIIGIMLIANPIGLSAGIIVVFGIALMVMGLGSIFRYFCTDPEEAAGGQLLTKGLIMALAGFVCTFYSYWIIATFPMLTLLFGIVVLVTGISKLQWTVDIIRMKRKNWFLNGLSALVSIVCGIMVITSPFSSTAVLWIFIGVSLIVDAAFDILAAIFGNK